MAEKNNPVMESALNHTYSVQDGWITIIQNSNGYRVQVKHQEVATYEYDHRITITGTISGLGSSLHILVDTGTQACPPVQITFENLKFGTKVSETPADAVSAGVVIRENANVKLTLLGTNVIYGGYQNAGIQLRQSANLEITADSTGSLEVYGGKCASGIGGTLWEFKTMGNITINGGTITAIGYAGGAGIGAYVDGDGITINGGKVTAIGDGSCGGIGWCRGKGNITIAGGDITAVGGRGESRNAQAGIEAGSGVISISGGNITASGNVKGAGIGSCYPDTSGTLMISGGTITATGGAKGMDIQVGNTPDTGCVVITGGSLRLMSGTIQQKPTNGKTPVYPNIITVGNPAIKKDGRVTAVSIDGIVTTPDSAPSDGYGIRCVDTSDSKLYFWLSPHESDTSNVEVTVDGVVYRHSYPRKSCDTSVVLTS